LIMDAVKRKVVAAIASESFVSEWEEEENSVANFNNLLLSHFPKLLINLAGNGPISAEFYYRIVCGYNWMNHIFGIWYVSRWIIDSRDGWKQVGAMPDGTDLEIGCPKL
jgi:hypothetical protein